MLLLGWFNFWTLHNSATALGHVLALLTMRHTSESLRTHLKNKFLAGCSGKKMSAKTLPI